jgi:tyrosinase
MALVRQDASAQGGGWGNKTLLNYALAMKELDGLPIANSNSWQFLAAMHGFDNDYWIDIGILPPGTNPPAGLTDNTYGNQCQHGSWYFLPWHRAYLFAFEQIVAATVKKATGDDWTLPYWNYLADGADAQKIPRAFLEDFLPDGKTPNPLKKYPRRKNISALPAPFGDGFSLKEMGEHDFQVGSDGSIGFGGGITGDFVQFAGWTGKVEGNPHNTVHGMVGGFMGNAITAALDPLFWLHHCNIDRLWEAWMKTPGNTMVHDPRWRNGPADRKFIMPSVGGGAGMQFTASQTLSGAKFYRGYDDLTKGTGVKPEVASVGQVPMGAPELQRVEPIGANDAPVRVGATAVHTQVRLDASAAHKGVAAMGATTPGQEVTRLYVALESVRGSAPSPQLDVYVNLPEGAVPEQHLNLRAARLTLFGLNVASRADQGHGGNGLGYTVDISDVAAQLSNAGSFDPEKLRVTLVPGDQVSDDEPITVERVSVLKRTGKVG